MKFRFRCLTTRVSFIFSSVSALTRVLIQGLFLSHLLQLAVSGILSLPVQLPPYCVLNMLASVHLILQAHSSVRAFEGSPPQY